MTIFLLDQHPNAVQIAALLVGITGALLTSIGDLVWKKCCKREARIAPAKDKYHLADEAIN